ncbi:long-chain acyl-CoA synthetase [Stigmatella aurantiaca]|uniref:Long-chain-fatty-acid--CoA ligase n=1 Tax=Stigmatella aurantiaca TaxID=41 RepID=A0A1H8C6G8_STIAU|nr:long-chain fatty acid--CoA ligase [Stigmatella aurantiaca]SEM90469.1 long-chain acyl-CoA synthetase [Stigmatella aurantiaca]
MEKLWLKHYPPGIPAEIDDRQYPSLTHLLEESFRKFADRPAFKCMGHSITYRELDTLSRQVGAWLQARGLPRGAAVAIMMPNVLQYPVCVAAILRAGYVVVNVNPLYTPRELEHQLKDSGAQALFILENFAVTLQQVLARTAVQHVVVASMGDLLGTLKGLLVNTVVRKIKKLVPPFQLPGAVPFKRVLAEGQSLTLTPVQASRDDVAFLQYTGGTTGVVKGATLLHRNVIANILQVDAWSQPTFQRKGVKQLHFVCALPMYHIFALTVCGLMGIRLGALIILIPNPRDIPAFVKTLSQQPFHVLPAVNTLYNALLNHPDFQKLDFSHLMISNGGGMAVQQAVAEKWIALTRVPLIEGYGLSETSPVVTSNLPDATEYSGTIGLPLPSTELSIRDDEGKELPLGQPGEICIRGPQVMAGYWNRPDETAQAMTPDGFFKSGDIGIMDERGHTRIVDRKKDMILVSGFNVYPNEIEGVAAMHPGILEAAAVGVPDAHSGEAVKLFVVKKDPSLTEAQVLDFCREQLAGYKRPRSVEFRQELPKSNVGKILRRELRGPPSA